MFFSTACNGFDNVSDIQTITRKDLQLFMIYMYVTYISIATIGLNGAHLHMLTSGVNALFMIYLLII